MDHENNPQLTEHEIRILQLVANGLTNKEIAYTLDIVERIVEYHLGEIFQRLNVVSRAAAAITAERMGLLRD